MSERSMELATSCSLACSGFGLRAPGVGLRALGVFPPDYADVVSRCVPIDQVDFAAMGGGRGITDSATDAELEFLRSDAQPTGL